MRTRIVLAIAVTTLTLAACGGDVDVAPRAERELQSQLDQIKAAVAVADRADARSALRELERSVGDLVSAGLVSEARAAEILSAAEDVAAQLSLLSVPSSSPSPSPEPTETSSPEPSGNEGDGNGNGNGHAYGHDEDHGNND
jgi:uncharacterized protein YfaQ (DUF2300 family)